MTLKELIVSIAGIMSVSGNERKNREALQALIGGVFDEYRTDALGNHLFIKKCGRPNAPRILVDTHFDEIGMMVTDIKEGGFVSVTNIGGVDTRILPASEVIIYGKEPVYGVFAAKAPHLSTAADMEKLTPLSEMLIDTGYTKEELKIDISGEKVSGVTIRVKNNIGTMKLNGKSNSSGTTSITL